MNRCSRRGPHFEAILLEYASLLIKRSSGCSLLQGPFAIPPTVALSKVLSCWGARLAWTAQRELAAQVIRGSNAHKIAFSFLSSVASRGQYNTVLVQAGGSWTRKSTTWPNCRTGSRTSRPMLHVRERADGQRGGAEPNSGMVGGAGAGGGAVGGVFYQGHAVK